MFGKFLAISCLLLVGSLLADDESGAIAAQKEVECCKRECNPSCATKGPCKKAECCLQNQSCKEKKPCKKKTCCRKEGSCCSPASQPSLPLCKDVTPSARGCTCKDGWVAFADFLWWQAGEEQGIRYAFNNSSEILDHGSIVTLDTSSDPGVRLGVGYNLNHDQWDLVGYWTYYHNSSTDSLSVPTNDVNLGLIPIFLNAVPFNVGFIKTVWKLNYNAFNVDLGRAFYVSNALALRPYISSETVWIHRWFAADAKSQNPGLPLLAIDTPGKYRTRIKYWGTGPRLGMNTKWYFGGTKFHFLSNLAFSLLYGKGKSHAMTSQAVNGIPDQTGVDLSEECWAVVPHMQLMLALGWEKCFCNDQFFTNFFVGWELNEFWHLASIMLPSGFSAASTSSGESIYMQGLTARIQCEF